MELALFINSEKVAKLALFFENRFKRLHFSKQVQNDYIEEFKFDLIIA